jgi:hypothetical protein
MPNILFSYAYAKGALFGLKIALPRRSLLRLQHCGFQRTGTSIIDKHAQLGKIEILGFKRYEHRLPNMHYARWNFMTR